MAEPHFVEYKNEPIEKYYDVHEALGKGAFSTVYRVVDKSSGKEYALKVMDKPPKSDVGKNKIINIEIEILKRLNHPNCVKLYAVFNNKDKISLVIQLITGGELFERIIELQSYSEQAAARLVRQLLEGLAHMHSNDVIHRDLKPENLLLSDRTERARVVITDFGLSDIMRPNEPITGAVGTPGYLAPEILIALDNGIPYGPEVDMFGVGVIAYILLSGIPPFYGNDEEEIYQKTETGNYSYIPEYWKNIGDDAKNFIDALLTLDRKKRLTAKEALKHTWLQAGKASTANMADTLKQLKRYQAKRKFQAAVKGLLAINKLKRLTMSESLLESIESKLKEEAARDNASAPFFGPVIFTGDGRFEADCNHVKKILQKHAAAYLEVKMSSDARYNVVLRKLGGGNTPPQVFLGHEVVGGLEELQGLDESGMLKSKLEGMPAQVLNEYADSDFLIVEIESGKKLAKKDLFASDPYVLVGIVNSADEPDFNSNPSGCGTSYFSTSIKKNTLNPKFSCVPLQFTGQNLAGKFLRIECWDHDKMSADDFMGVANIPIGTSSSTKERDFPLQHRPAAGAPQEKVSGSISLRCELFPSGAHLNEANVFRQRANLSKRVATHMMQQKLFADAKAAQGGRTVIPKKEKDSKRAKSKKFSTESVLADILTAGSGFAGVLLEEPILTEYYPDSVSKIGIGRSKASQGEASTSSAVPPAKKEGAGEPQPFVLRVEQACLAKGTEQASMCWLGKLWNPFQKELISVKISEQRQRPTFFDDGDFVDGVSASDIVYLLVNDTCPTSRFHLGLACVVTGGEVAAPRELIQFSDGESRLPIRAITDVVWTEHALL